MFLLHKSIIPTVWTPPSVPTACTTRLVDKLHNKSRSHMQKHVHAVQNRTIDARKTTQPSSTQSQIGTGKKDAHDKNTPEIAAWTHVDDPPPLGLIPDPQGAPQPEGSAGRTRRSQRRSQRQSWSKERARSSSSPEHGPAAT